jgi:hypothetical protein
MSLVLPCPAPPPPFHLVPVFLSTLGQGHMAEMFYGPWGVKLFYFTTVVYLYGACFQTHL